MARRIGVLRMHHDGQIISPRGVEHMAVAQAEVDHISDPQRQGTVLHVEDTVVGRAAHHTDARLHGAQRLQLTHVGAAERDERPQL